MMNFMPQEKKIVLGGTIVAVLLLLQGISAPHP
ncbi:MAG: hypothetical protein H6Q61_1330 [Firmicutes bacterium]|nr:hypothetical protein [Bacillota bacterium]